MLSFQGVPDIHTVPPSSPLPFVAYGCGSTLDPKVVTLSPFEGPLQAGPYYRGLNNYLYYFGGVPYYIYGIIYTKTLF